MSKSDFGHGKMQKRRLESRFRGTECHLQDYTIGGTKDHGQFLRDTAPLKLSQEDQSNRVKQRFFKCGIRTNSITI